MNDLNMLLSCSGTTMSALPPLSLPLRAFARPADFKSKIRGLGRSRVGEART